MFNILETPNPRKQCLSDEALWIPFLWENRKHNIKGRVGLFCQSSNFDLSLKVSYPKYRCPSLQSYSPKTHEHFLTTDRKSVV